MPPRNRVIRRRIPKLPRKKVAHRNPPKIMKFDHRSDQHTHSDYDEEDRDGCGGCGRCRSRCGGCGGCGQCQNGCGGCGNWCGNGCGIGNGCGPINNGCGTNTVIYYDQFGFPVYQSVPPLPINCTTCPVGYNGYGGLPFPGTPFSAPGPYVPAPPMFLPGPSQPMIPPALPQSSNMCPLPY